MARATPAHIATFFVDRDARRPEMMRILKHSYDLDVGAAYARVSEGSVAEPSEVAPGLILDWSAEDRPVDLEVLDVRRPRGDSDLLSLFNGLAEGRFADPAEAAEWPSPFICRKLRARGRYP